MWQSRLFYLIGCWVLILSCAQVVPFVVATVAGEQEAASAFLASLMISLLAGGSLLLGFRSSAQVKVPRLTILLPILGGVSLAFVSGLPFFFLFPDQGLIPSFFEGMSLITTTGVSAFEGAVEQLYSVTLWRALAAWIGGLTAICMALSILTAINSGGLQLHRSPLPYGDSDTGYPRLKAVALTVAPFYVLVTVFCWLLLVIAGADVFHAVIWAMGAIATCGISVSGEGTIAGSGVQVILMTFMLMAMLNWDVLYARARQLKAKHPYGTETRSVLFVMAGAVLLFALMVFPGDWTGLWHSVFIAVSALSTTGYLPEDMGYSGLGAAVAAVMVPVLACIGGASASTSGGLRQLRLVIIYFLGRSEVDRLAHPHGVRAIKYQGFTVEKRDIVAVWLLTGAFVLTLITGSLLLAIMGVDFQAAVSMTVSALTLSGPLVSIMDPFFGGFSGLREADYMILSALMLVGRVEASLFLALFAKSFWRG